MYYITNQPINIDNLVRWKDNKKLYFKQYHAQTFECECGKTIKVSSKSKHMMSMKHRIYTLEKLNETISHLGSQAE